MGLTMANTLAYLVTEFITAESGFIARAPEEWKISFNDLKIRLKLNFYVLISPD